MFSYLPTLGVLLLVTAGKVTSVDDFHLTCPQEWSDNAKEQLLCTIPVNKFSSSAPCGLYADSVIFKYVKGSNIDTDCTVVNIDTVCNNSSNSDGCGCREKNATHVTVFDNVIAVRNLHENAKWNCEPQCLTTGGDQVLSAINTTECFKTSFADPCKSYLCHSNGVCYVNGMGDPECNCSGTNHFGDQCEYNACDNHFGEAVCAVSESNPTMAYYHCNSGGYYKGSDCGDRTNCSFCVIGLACTASVVVLLLLSIIIKLFTTIYESVRVFDVMTDENIANFAVFLDSQICQDELERLNKIPVCCIGSANVKVCGHCLCDGPYTKSDNKPLRIIVSGPLICYFALNTLADQVELWFVTQMDLCGLPGPSPPCLPRVCRRGCNNPQCVCGPGSTNPPCACGPGVTNPLCACRRGCNNPQCVCGPGSTNPPCACGPGVTNPLCACGPGSTNPLGTPMSQATYTGKGKGQKQKSKSDKAIPLSSVGRSSPPSEASGDEKTHMIPSTKGRVLPVPANQHEPTSIGIGKSASPRLDPLKQDHSKMPSVERNSGAFPRKVPSPGQPPLEPIPLGKKS